MLLPTILLNAGVVQKWSHALKTLHDAKMNVYLSDTILSIVQLFAEFASNSLFHAQMAQDEELLKLMFHGFVI